MHGRTIRKVSAFTFMLTVLFVSACAKKAPPPPPPGPTPAELGKMKEDAKKQELAKMLSDLGKKIPDYAKYTLEEMERMLKEAQAQASRKKLEEEQLLALKNKEIRLMDEMRGQDFKEPPADIAFHFQRINFDFDKAVIKEEFRDELQDTADFLKSKPQIEVLVEGHCDERGTNEYNMGLGQRRALAVRSYLISLGVSSEKVHTISLGEERPLDKGRNEIAWAMNRRAQYKVRVP